jgi:hypothetical protein
LNQNIEFPRFPKIAEIMPDVLSDKFVEIMDSCDLVEVHFTGIFVNKNKQ